MRQYLIITTNSKPEIVFSIFKFFSPGEKLNIKSIFDNSNSIPMSERMYEFEKIAKEWISKTKEEEKEKTTKNLDYFKEAVSQNHYFYVKFVNPEEVMNSLIIDGMKKTIGKIGKLKVFRRFIRLFL